MNIDTENLRSDDPSTRPPLVPPAIWDKKLKYDEERAKRQANRKTPVPEPAVKHRPEVTAAQQVIEESFAEATKELRSDCKFRTRILPAASSLADGIEQGTLKRKNVYTLGVNKLVVKYFIGGKQRVLAFYDSADYESAYRLADLAIHIFHSVKKRGPSKLTEESYNLSPEQVKFDLINEFEIVSMLRSIEALVPDKTFYSATKKQTARQEFSKMLETLSRLSLDFDKMNLTLDKVVRNQERMLERLNALERPVVMFPSGPATPPQIPPANPFLPPSTEPYIVTCSTEKDSGAPQC